MNFCRTLKKAFLSYHLPSEFVQWREIEADRNQWRALWGSKTQQMRHRSPPDKTSGLSLDTALNPQRLKKLVEKFRWANERNKEREKKYIQLDQLAWNPETLQLRHNNEKFKRTHTQEARPVGLKKRKCFKQIAVLIKPAYRNIYQRSRLSIRVMSNYWLRVPSRWHVCKEAQRRQIIWQCRRLFVFSELTGIPSAGSRKEWSRTSQGCWPRSLIRVSLGWLGH
jgi:hypothetical protein